MNPVDPGSGQIGESREVGFAGQPLGLEAAHLAGRGRLTIQAGPPRRVSPDRAQGGQRR